MFNKVFRLSRVLFSLEEIGLNKKMQAFEPEKCTWCGETDSMILKSTNREQGILSLLQYVLAKYSSKNDLCGLTLYILKDDDELAVNKFYPTGMKNSLYSGINSIDELRDVIKHDSDMYFKNPNWKSVNKYIFVRELFTGDMYLYTQVLY